MVTSPPLRTCARAERVGVRAYYPFTSSLCAIAGDKFEPLNPKGQKGTMLTCTWGLEDSFMSSDRHSPAKRKWQRAVLLTAAISFPPVAPVPAAQIGASPGPSIQCSKSAGATIQSCICSGGHTVTVRSCLLTLEPSDAGNPDYLVTITIGYTAPSPTVPVRFQCVFGNGSTTLSQYGVSRQSPAILKFISPFPTLKSIQCSVNAT